MTRPGATIWARDRARDGVAVAAGLAGPLAAAAVLLPFRAGWSNTNVALLLVVALADQAGRAYSAGQAARSRR